MAVLPVTPILDNFDIPDQNPLRHQALWAQMGTGGGTNRNLQVTSQAVRGTTNAVFNANSWAGGTYGPDSEVYCTFKTLSATAATYVRLYVRADAASLTGDNHNTYMLQCAQDVGVTLFVRVAGSTDQIGSNSAAVPAAGDQILLRASGTLISVYVAGNLAVAVNDSTYKAAGSLALGYRATDGAIDNFGGGTITDPNVLSNQAHVFGHNVW